MELYFPLETIQALAKAGCKTEQLADSKHIYRGDTIDSREILEKDLKIIESVLNRPEFSASIDNRRILKKLAALAELRKAPAGKSSVALKILELVPEAVKDIIGPLPHKWLFMPHPVFGAMMPWLVTEAEFQPAERTAHGYSPARATISLEAISQGEKESTTITLYKDDLKKRNLLDILAAKDAVPETLDLVKDYETDLARYMEHFPRTGEQYLASGLGKPCEEAWKRPQVNLERDGRPTKVVMDDLEFQKDSSGYTHTDFWSGKKRVKIGRSDEEAEETFKLPIHPVVTVFSLDGHEFLDCHISNLTPYIYDEKLVEKLILPDDHKSLIDTLTRSSAGRLEDIVKGKASGVIILCSGLPGTGKTLTAEVYSEVVKRPLYAVQCAQLGTNAEELEKKLSDVLSRAARWKAILLIDESDVYIHERGLDIQQNAIVGVFLRLLEYFRGIMFLTTNRALIVDDAILSRVTAHVRYTPPQDDDQTTRLWTTLADQFGVKGLDVKAAMKAFPGIGGRSVRQLLRLSVMTHPINKISVDTLHWAAKFYDFPELEERGTT